VDEGEVADDVLASLESDWRMRVRQLMKCWLQLEKWHVTTDTQIDTQTDTQTHRHLSTEQRHIHRHRKETTPSCLIFSTLTPISQFFGRCSSITISHRRQSPAQLRPFYHHISRKLSTTSVILIVSDRNVLFIHLGVQMWHVFCGIHNFGSFAQTSQNFPKRSCRNWVSLVRVIIYYLQTIVSPHAALRQGEDRVKSSNHAKYSAMELK
jgi:hypothetical protein